jgi:hypothetical protein
MGISLLENLESGSECLAEEWRVPRIVDEHDTFDFANAARTEKPLLVWPD